MLEIRWKDAHTAPPISPKALNDVKD